MAAETKDRREKLLESTTLNGIDFVEIDSSDPTTLRVHFLNAVLNAVDLKGQVSKVQITGGETIPTVALRRPIDDTKDWKLDPSNRPVLTLQVVAPGDFSLYTLTLTRNRPLTSNRLDPFFAQATFSFKALCPSDLDCKAVTPVCPLPKPGDSQPIDYLAKDFLSFRKALSDFSALRYPDWVERSEADFGVMFMEALCSLADELSYTQDRIAAEAMLDTATQRRSIVRHARLVDYEPRPVTSAQVLLQFDVQTDLIPAGLLVSAQGPEGATIEFETGTGLADQTHYIVNPLWNRGIQPYYWDDSQRCLKAGATEMWVLGHGFNFQARLMDHPEQPLRLLIDTEGATPADSPVREVVQLMLLADKEPEEPTDPLFNQDVTHIVWRAEDALKFDHDLTKTVLAGNLIPATQGRRSTETFAIPPDPENPPTTPPPLPLALVRTGPNGTPAYLYTLRQGRLTWLAQDDPDAPPLPEILLTEQPSVDLWGWRQTLLAAEPVDKAVTIDPVRFSRIANSDGSPMYDYDGDNGDTLRFGDGSFGAIPNFDAVFRVSYRVGVGGLGNVAADSITKVDSALVSAVTNPFAAQGGADEEPIEQVRRLAPQAFRAQQFRAVRPEDYQAAAQTLPWVQRAGTTFRWTGSWLTVFTTADPLGSTELPVDRHTQLIDLLNRYRLAGYESYVPTPQYVSLDLLITVCAQPDAFRGDVVAAILTALSTAKSADGTTGFFHVDRFTFGTPLERSVLEAVIQAALGVAGVLSIQYRQRGVLPNYVEMPDTVAVGADAILRLDNDPSRPERGSLRVIVEGGK